MKVATVLFKEDSFVREVNADQLNFSDPDLVLGFGARTLLADQKVFDQLRNKFPTSELILCSSAGEIYGNEVLDDTIALTALKFSSTRIKTCQVDITAFENSFQAGCSLIEKLDQQDLKMVLIFSDGGKVNGSELVKGMNTKKKSKF
jgi:hypothetical protein